MLGKGGGREMLKCCVLIRVGNFSLFLPSSPSTVVVDSAIFVAAPQCRDFLVCCNL